MAPDSLLGRTLAETYAVVRLIGKGGMGSIYEAHHTRLAGKRYAIKILSPQFAENPELLARFRREAEIASQLGHENIVEVHDFNLAGGQAYMVMELLEGEDLAGRIRERGAMSLESTKRVIDQVASALDAAHRAHIVHRDLKPPNIFLCHRGGRDDYVKVLDFGVSKVLDSASVVTRDHALVGTPYYMSPEQAEGRISEIDARTDVFALGAMAWEMLTGKMAFGAPTFSVALYKVCFVDPPEVHLLRGDVPPAVSMVIRRALSKERFTRTASVLEFAAELAAALHGVMPTGVPAPAPDGTGSVAGMSLPRLESPPRAGSTAPAPTPSFASLPPASSQPQGQHGSGTRVGAHSPTPGSARPGTPPPAPYPPAPSPPSAYAPSYAQPQNVMGTPAPVGYAGSAPWAGTPGVMPGPPPWSPPGTYNQGSQAPGFPPPASMHPSGTQHPASLNQSIAAGSVVDEPPLPSPSRKGLIAALILGGAAIVGTGIWIAVARPDEPPSPKAPAGAVVAVPTPPPTPVERKPPEAPLPVPQVALVFTVDPPGIAADIAIDGKPMADRNLRVDQSDKPLAVTAEAKARGYSTFRAQVIPDADKTVAIVFRKKAPPKVEAKVEPPTPPPVKVEPPAPQPVDTQPPPTPQPVVTQPAPAPPLPPAKKRTGTIFDQ